MQGENEARESRSESRYGWASELVRSEDEIYRRAYTQEEKVQAVRAHLEEGLSTQEAMQRYQIRSKSAFFRWCTAYREGGPDALRPRRRGRPPKNRD